MLNAVSKTLLLAALPLLAACSSAEKAEAEAADQLVAEAAAALDRGDYSQSETLLDSLTATYPKQIAAGRKALALRPRVIVRKTEQEIVDLQALMAYTRTYADSLAGQFRSVGVSDDVFEPYLIHKDIPENWRDRNTAVARLTPSGEFYVISSVATRTAGHTALRLSADGMSVTSGSVPFDATDRLSRESVRFPQAKADTLGAFALQLDGRGIAATLEFVGGKPAPKAKLSAKELHAMADTYRLGRAMTAITSGAKRLQQLKAKLQLAHDQTARTTSDPEEE